MRRRRKATGIKRNQAVKIEKRTRSEDCKKYIYATIGKARKAMKRLSGTGTCRAYYCNRCNGYHLTSQKQRSA